MTHRPAPTNRIKKIKSRLHQLLPASVHVIITNEKGSTDRGPPSASEHGGMANGGGVHVANMTRAPAGAGSQVQLWSRMRGSRRCSARAFFALRTCISASQSYLLPPFLSMCRSNITLQFIFNTNFCQRQVLPKRGSMSMFIS